MGSPSGRIEAVTRTAEDQSMGTLRSVNVGMPRTVFWRGRTVYTGVWKAPVAGAVAVRRLNLDGDGQGDKAGHGGEQRAILVYQLESYRYWQEFLHRDDFGYGQFGENFTVDGLADDEVCIGDRYRIGDALFEVTQPRVACYGVGIRMADPQIPALLVQHRRPGFYLRVLQEGAADPAPARRAALRAGLGRAGGVVRPQRPRLPWQDGYGTLLDLAEACDVPVRWSCRTGVCHNCESGLLSGEVRYDVEPVDPPAEGSVLICSARPSGPVVLDL
jgi:MOSC domain-containing protein YiiM